MAQRAVVSIRHRGPYLWSSYFQSLYPSGVWYTWSLAHLISGHLVSLILSLIWCPSIRHLVTRIWPLITWNKHLDYFFTRIFTNPHSSNFSYTKKPKLILNILFFLLPTSIGFTADEISASYASHITYNEITHAMIWEK